MLSEKEIVELRNKYNVGSVEKKAVDKNLVAEDRKNSLKSQPSVLEQQSPIVDVDNKKTFSEKHPIISKLWKTKEAIRTGAMKELGTQVMNVGRLGSDILRKTGLESEAIGGKEGIDETLAPVEQALQKEGTTEQVGGLVLNVAELATPVGAETTAAKLSGLISSKIPAAAKFAPTISKVVANAIADAFKFGSQEYASKGDEANVSGAATIGGITGAVAPVVGEVMKAVGPKIAEKVIPMSAREAKMVQGYKANYPFWDRVLGKTGAPRTAGATAFDKGLMGSESQIGIKAKRASKNVWENVVDPALKRTSENVNLKSFFDEARQSIIKNNPELSRQGDLLEALSSIEESYAGKTNIDYSELQALKEGWAKYVPEKAYRGKPITGAYNDVRDTLSDMARSKIYDTLGDEVKQAYFDYGNLKGLEELGQKAMTGGKLKGGFGGFWSAVKDMAVIPTGTVGGRIIYKAGEGAEFIGRAGAKVLKDLFD
jgi:hypothetical protein